MSNSPNSIFSDLTGKRALVTGSSSGIGKAIALELARAGADVIIHFAHSEGAALQVAQQVEDAGRQTATLQADLRNIHADDFVERAWQLLGGLEIWVNNAGVDLLTGEGAGLDYHEKLRRLWEVDVQGTVFLSRAIAARMKEHGGGVILNIGWDQADRGMEGDSAELFATSKNAIAGFSRSFALSVAPDVRVNCIAPGWIQTAWGEQTSEKWHHRVLSETPLRRWGQPHDIAKLARFLVSDEASYLTGQVINANGGAVR